MIARLFSLVVQEHAAAHNLSNPQIVPIPSKENGKGMDVLSDERVSRLNNSTRFHKRCVGALDLAVGAERVREIKAEIRNSAG